MFYKKFLAYTFLFLLLLIFYSCTAEICRVRYVKQQEKNGKYYCVTKEGWQNRWWNYYERALSCADGGFWKEAEGDLIEAIRQKKSDKIQALMYGYHYIDYFPNRELGIVLYNKYIENNNEDNKKSNKWIKDSIKYLETSLKKVRTERGEKYLQLARQETLDDQNFPELAQITIETLQNSRFEFPRKITNKVLQKDSVFQILVKSPQKVTIIKPQKFCIDPLQKVGTEQIGFGYPQRQFLSNAFSVLIKGTAKDDSYIKSIKINNEDIRFDVLKAKEPLFWTRISLDSDKKEISVSITDLSNKTSEIPITIFTDYVSPLIKIDQPFEGDEIHENGVVRVKGYSFDKSGLAEVRIIGKEKNILPVTKKGFPFDELVEPDGENLVVEAEDKAGNVNSVRISLSKREKDILIDPVIETSDLLIRQEFSSYSHLWLAENFLIMNAFPIYDRHKYV